MPPNIYSKRDFHFIFAMVDWVIITIVVMVLFVFLMLFMLRTIIIIIAKRKLIVTLYSPMRTHRSATA